MVPVRFVPPFGLGDLRQAPARSISSPDAPLSLHASPQVDSLQVLKDVQRHACDSDMETFGVTIVPVVYEDSGPHCETVERWPRYMVGVAAHTHSRAHAPSPPLHHHHHHHSHRTIVGARVLGKVGR